MEWAVWQSCEGEYHCEQDCDQQVAFLSVGDDRPGSSERAIGRNREATRETVRQPCAAQGLMALAPDGRDYRAFHELDSLFPLIPMLMDYAGVVAAYGPGLRLPNDDVRRLL